MEGDRIEASRSLEAAGRAYARANGAGQSKELRAFVKAGQYTELNDPQVESLAGTSDDST